MISNYRTKHNLNLSHFALLSLLVVGIILVTSNPIHSNASQAPLVLATGDPVAAACCAGSGCHGGGQINTGTGNITITSDAPNNTYMVGQTYNITYTVNEPAKVKFGFESVALNKSLVSSGNFVVKDAASTFVTKGATSGRIYTGHLAAGSKKSWTVSWTAPATFGDSVTICAFGVAADGNGNAGSTDNVYRATLLMKSAFPAGVNPYAINEKDLEIFPNPSIDKVNISLDNATADPTTIVVYDMQMKKVLETQAFQSASQVSAYFNVNTWVAGTYFVKVSNGNKSAVRKIVVQSNP